MVHSSKQRGSLSQLRLTYQRACVHLSRCAMDLLQLLQKYSPDTIPKSKREFSEKCIVLRNRVENVMDNWLPEVGRRPTKKLTDVEMLEYEQTLPWLKPHIMQLWQKRSERARKTGQCVPAPPNFLSNYPPTKRRCYEHPPPTQLSLATVSFDSWIFKNCGTSHGGPAIKIFTRGHRPSEHPHFRIDRPEGMCLHVVPLTLRELMEEDLLQNSSTTTRTAVSLRWPIKIVLNEMQKKFFRELEERVLRLAQENSKEWFGKEKEEVNYRLKSVLTDGGRLLHVKVIVAGEDKYMTNVYVQRDGRRNEEPFRGSQIHAVFKDVDWKRCTIRARLAVPSLWFYNGTFGLRVNYRDLLLIEEPAVWPEL